MTDVDWCEVTWFGQDGASYVGGAGFNCDWIGGGYLPASSKERILDFAEWLHSLGVTELTIRDRVTDRP